METTKDSTSKTFHEEIFTIISDGQKINLKIQYNLNKMIISAFPLGSIFYFFKELTYEELSSHKIFFICETIDEIHNAIKKIIEQKTFNFEKISNSEYNLKLKDEFRGKTFTIEIILTKQVESQENIISNLIQMTQDIFQINDSKDSAISNLHTEISNLKDNYKILLNRLDKNDEEIAEKNKKFYFESYKVSENFLFGNILAGTQNVNHLSEKCLKTGLCSNGWIIVQFNRLARFEKIEIASWNGNPTIWPVNTGSGADISISSNCIDWVKIGKIPNNYGTLVTQVNFPKTEGSYLKFELIGQKFGIGYLNVIELKKLNI